MNKFDWEGVGNGFLMIKKKYVEKGAAYHVIHRAPGMERIFLEDSDYLHFIKFLKETKENFLVDVYAFVLMSNHVHILLRINRKNLSESMHSLFTRYGKYYNLKYERKGPVFSSPYRATLCMYDEYLLAVSCYIHLNPVAAGIVSHWKGYKWSSATLYTGYVKKESFVDPTRVLELLDRGIDKARQEYSVILDNWMVEKAKGVNVRFEKKSDYEKLKEFIANIVLKRGCICYVDKKDSIEEKILLVRMAKRGAPFKKEAIGYLVGQLKVRGYTMKEIAEKIGVSRATLYRIDKKE